LQQAAFEALVNEVFTLAIEDTSNVAGTTARRRTRRTTVVTSSSSSSSNVAVDPTAPLILIHAASSSRSSHTAGVGTAGATSITLATGASMAYTDRRKLRMVILHGALMLFGWGIFVPAGVTAAMLRPLCARLIGEGGWFRLHVYGNVLGLLLATAGLGVGLGEWGGRNLDGADPAVPELSHAHAVIGVAVMAAGWLQPLLARLRPKAPAPGTAPGDVPLKRRVWRLCHAGLGRAGLLQAEDGRLTHSAVVHGAALGPGRAGAQLCHAGEVVACRVGGRALVVATRARVVR